MYFSIVKSVYDYKDYRRYILDYYSEQKKFAGFSWRDFARAAGFGSPVYLKIVCDGKNGLSKNARAAVAKAMGLEGYEAEYFALLVDYAHAKTSELKQKALEKMNEILATNRVGILERELFQYYSTWLHSAIRELAASVTDASPEKLAELCQWAVSPEVIADSLKFLTQKQFLRKSTTKGQYVQGKKSISTGKLATSVLTVRNLHRQMGELALKSLDNVPVSERNFSTITLGLTREAYETIIEELSNFRQKIVALAAHDPQTERVYEINMQLFPLSKKLPAGIQKFRGAKPRKIRNPK